MATKKQILRNDTLNHRDTAATAKTRLSAPKSKKAQPTILKPGEKKLPLKPGPKPDPTKRKPGETPEEHQRRLLVMQFRRALGVSAKAAFGKAAFVRQEDVVGLLMGLHVDPPMRTDIRTGDLIVDSRGLSQKLKVLKELRAAIPAMRQERADAPERMRITIDFAVAEQAPPDEPIFADDYEEAQNKAKENQAKEQAK